MESLLKLVKKGPGTERMPKTWKNNEDVVYIGSDTAELVFLVKLLEERFKKLIHHISFKNINEIKNTNPCLIICSVNESLRPLEHLEIFTNLRKIFPVVEIIWVCHPKHLKKILDILTAYKSNYKSPTFFDSDNDLEQLISLINHTI